LSFVALLLIVLIPIAVLLFAGSTGLDLKDALPGATLIEAVGIGGLAGGWIGALAAIALWMLCFLDGGRLITIRMPVRGGRN